MQNSTLLFAAAAAAAARCCCCCCCCCCCWRHVWESLFLLDVQPLANGNAQLPLKSCDSTPGIAFVGSCSSSNAVVFIMSHAAPGPHRSSSPSPGNYESSHRSGKWDSGFFDVFAVGCREMCQAHFCPCVTYAQNEQTLQQLENPDLHHSKLRNACQIPFYCSLLCCGAHCFLHQRYRLRIRSLYQINYGPYGETGDFLMSWCLFFCPSHCTFC